MGEQSISSRAFNFRIEEKKAKLFNLLQPHGWALAYGSMLLLITNLIMVCLPRLINGGVSLIEKDEPFVLQLFFLKIRFVHIYWIFFGVILLALVGSFMRTLSRMVIFDVGRTVERDVRARLFFHISILDDYFFSKTSVGDLINHLTTDVTNIRMATGFAVLNIINIVFVFCFTVPLLLKINVWLALCALLPFPLVIIATSSISKKMFHVTSNYQEKLSNMVSHIQENLLGAHIVRLFHQQHHESMRFKNTNQDTYDAGIKLANVRVLMMPIMRLIVGMSVGLVLYVGGREILAGHLTLGDFVEVNARILQLSWPAMSVGFVMSVYSRGQASVNRINQLLSYVPIIVDGERTIRGISKIDVRNLSLKPSDKEHVSFSVKRGQVLGIVGASGSYKTTLLRSLYRRQQIAFGTIFFDEHDINDITLTSIYEEIAVVSQESFLFHESIKNNICFVRPHASSEEIDEVVKLVCLDRDCAAWKNGLDTIIGERGVTLSGGQRQRIALARALLAKRSVIILDDVLSSVDALTARHIVSGLKRYLNDAIVIIATHKLSAIRDAHQILVLDNGLVAASGTHEELMRCSEIYQSLWAIERLKGHWS